MKKCSKCREEKPATSQYFHKAKSNKDGLFGVCKVCRSEYAKKRREVKRESIDAYMDDWRKENKKHISEYNKKYYKLNIEYEIERSREWRKQNKELHKTNSKNYYNQNKEYYKKYRELHKQKHSEYIKKYNKQYPEVSRKAYNKRQAKKRKLPYTLNVKQWNDILNSFNHQCAYCGIDGKLEQEHFIALSKGGEYTHNNIIPSCRRCNASKSDRNFFEWYFEFEHYSKKREEKILEYLGYIDTTQQLSLMGGV